MTYLTVVLDCNLTMTYQVSKIVRIYTYKLHLVNIIPDKRSVHVAEWVVNAMVSDNLDYCNSLRHSWEGYKTQQPGSYKGETIIVVLW